jgi:hypothetical protein
MFYKKGSFELESDYEIRVLREELGDIDLYMDTDDRVINLFLPNIKGNPISRLQLPKVKGVLIRFWDHEDNHTATIHFLRNIDLQSHFLNFEFDYKGHKIMIENKDFYIDCICKEK